MKKLFNNRKFNFLTSALVLGGSVSAQYSPTPVFQGKIGKTIADTKESQPDTQVHAPKGAPNVIWILLDDVGYGAITAFGGLIETPNIDRLANQGLRYTNFHTCAFSAPTRAALLTGRNNHSVHFGFFAHNSFNTPGYDGYLPFEKATIAEILRENGYNTFAVGKYHLTHPSDATQSGPFNRWPTGRGFDHYFGFPPEAWGTDQWHPTLYRDTQREPEDPKGRHATELLVNNAIQYISDQKAATPDKPFFLYLAPGAGHVPHQVGKEWSDRYKGKFDKGWDWYRQEVLERQKKLGVVPANATLAPQNNGVKPWEQLSEKEKKVYARQFEVYAGFISQADSEIGRIIDYLDQISQLDNTLIAVMVGDNGAESGGGDYGWITQTSASDNHEQILEKEIKNLDKLGTAYSMPAYPAGWAAAENTPFRYYKGYAAFEGGTRDPLILFYPKKIKDAGGIRNQYSYVNDILPTTVELIGAKVPQVINGYIQEPIEGTSLAYTIDAENKNVPERHNIQYNESTGSFSIYKDGWKASFPKEWVGKVLKKSDEVLHLYNLKEDFNEQNDLAGKYPEKLRELADLFEAEAWKYNVFPLKDKWETLNKNIFHGTKRLVLHQGNYFTTFTVPFKPDLSYSIRAKVTIDKNTQGVILAEGGFNSGLSFYVKNQKLIFAYRVGEKLIEVRSESNIPRGKVELKVDVANNNNKARDIVLYVNGNQVAIDHPIIGVNNFYQSNTEGLQVGEDRGTAVSTSYDAPFAFTGKIENVTIDLK